MLNLYRYNGQTRQDLLTILDKLGDRLWIPNQVLVEFWKNREGAILDTDDSGNKAITELSAQRDASINAVRTWSNRLALPDESKNKLEQSLRHSYESLIAEISKTIDNDGTRRMRDTHNDTVLQSLERIPFTTDPRRLGMRQDSLFRRI